MLKTLSRVADATYLIFLSAKSAAYLAAGALLLGFAGCLAYTLSDPWLLLVFPALFGGKGISLVMRALEPFAGRRPRPPEGRGRKDLMKAKGPPQRGGPGD
jgi:hypothetical protein